METIKTTLGEIRVARIDEKDWFSFTDISKILGIRNDTRLFKETEDVADHAIRHPAPVMVNGKHRATRRITFIDIAAMKVLAKKNEAKGEVLLTDISRYLTGEAEFWNFCKAYEQRLIEAEKEEEEVRKQQACTTTTDNYAEECDCVVAQQLETQAEKMHVWLNDVAIKVRKAQGLINKQRMEIADLKLHATKREEVEKLRDRVALMKPIYEAYKMGSKLYCASYVGSIFGLTAYQLNAILKDEGIQAKDSYSGRWYLTADYNNKGYAHVVPVPTAEGEMTECVRWTQRGIVLIEQVLAKRGVKRLVSTLEKDKQQEINFQ